MDNRQVDIYVARIKAPKLCDQGNDKEHRGGLGKLTRESFKNSVTI